MKLKRLNPNGGALNLSPEPIQKILSNPALVVIASRESVFRQIMQEQMAVAIATGKPFLKHFETHQQRVLILRKGDADLQQTNERIEKMFQELNRDRPVVKKIDDWIRVEATDQIINSLSPSGLLGYLEKYSIKNQYNVIFIPDYIEIHTPVRQYIERHETGLLKGISISKLILPLQKSGGKEIAVANVKIPADQLSTQQFVAGRDAMCIKMLRNFAEKRQLCIVMGHSLISDNKFKSPYEVKGADVLLRLADNKEGWKLIIEGGGGKVPANTMELKYREDVFFRLSDKEVSRFSPAPLSKNDIKVIKAMKGKGPMTHTEIRVATGLPKSTVNQRLGALQKPEKGSIIIKHNKTYQLNENKKVVQQLR